jgi:hypothetical protein
MVVGLVVGGLVGLQLPASALIIKTPSEEDIAKLGVFIGTHTLIGANFDWYFLKYNISVDSTLYYRISSVPGDFILGSDIKLKRYAGPIVNNKTILYEGIGIGYASLQNLNYIKEFTGLYYNHEKDNYFYIIGSLGGVYFGDKYDYYFELQPVAAKNSVTLLFKMGIYL